MRDLSLGALHAYEARSFPCIIAPCTDKEKYEFVRMHPVSALPILVAAETPSPARLS